MKRDESIRNSGRYGYETSEERNGSAHARSALPRDYEPDNAPRRDGLDRVRLKTLRDLDQRTRAAKMAQRLVAELEHDLGGDLTAAQKELVQRAALLGAMLEDAEARWLEDRPADLTLYGMLADRQRRCLQALGLRRLARNVTPGDLSARIISAVRSAP